MQKNKNKKEEKCLGSLNIKRTASPDRVYSNKLVSKFINHVMLDGKKSLAETLVYKSFDKLAEKTGESGLESFLKVVENITPKMKSNQDVLVDLHIKFRLKFKSEEGIPLAMKWLISFARSKTGSSFIDCLSSELIDAYSDTGSCAKTR